MGSEGDEWEVYREQCLNNNENYPQLVIIKSNKQKFFGGFYNKPFTNLEKKLSHIQDSLSFVFSLDEKIKFDAVDSVREHLFYSYHAKHKSNSVTFNDAFTFSFKKH